MGATAEGLGEGGQGLSPLALHLLLVFHQRVVGELLGVGDVSSALALQLQEHGHRPLDLHLVIGGCPEHNGVLFVNICGREVPEGLPSILIILIKANLDVIFLHLVTKQVHFISTPHRACCLVHSRNLQV